ncbi:MAG: dethiobiotin synthase [Gammaproteobacteria bacterium]
MPMAANGLFVTATDTAMGKTRFALTLMARLQAAGLRVNGMKPVASGCETSPAGWRNADAVQIQARCSTQLDYADINPYAFAPAIAPHIAAAADGTDIKLTHIADCYARISGDADVVVVEGAGGWLVPLGGGNSWAEVADRLDLQIVLVVGMRLGCINHALLTAQAITASGRQLAGWVANQIDPAYTEPDATIACLQAAIAAPFIGLMPHNETAAPESPDSARLHIDRLPVKGVL